MTVRAATCAVLAVLVLTGCPRKVPAASPAAPEGPAPEGPAPEGPAPKQRFDALSRADFNQRAAERFQPLFWREDANGNGALDPDELVVVWGYGDVKRERLVGADGFTDAFAALYASLLQPERTEGLPPEEVRRRAAVRRELAQGRPTLLTTAFPVTEEDRAVIQHVSRAAELVERLYARQTGTLGQEAGIPEGDTASRMLFHRNQRPQCAAPQTENDPDCSALPSRPKPVSGLYPAGIQAEPGFCDRLAKQRNAKELMDHFSVVVADEARPGAFRAVPYHVAYREDMEEVARELMAAATALSSPQEAAFKAYLEAAAQAFRTNDWEPANAAWAAMGAQNSRWYLRIAPDEVYFEPCAWKAGFAVAFARINPGSLAWQQKLDPVKGDMEKALAALAGPPYRARQVAFKLPDFIDLLLNAGDARDPHGGTVGQSLPNWGPTAAKGGRTVTMTNMAADADSRATLRVQMASLFCRETNAQASTGVEPVILSVVLHEAAHNLGPAHEYRVKGRKDDELFGGPLAAMLEELKAQTAALSFPTWLVQRGQLTADQARDSHLRDVVWGFGQVSRGMYTPEGTPKTYSHVGAIQLGTLRDAGVLVWEPQTPAANGKDTGCFQVVLERWQPAVEALAKTVLQTKARGDRKAAEALKARYVDAGGEWKQLRDTITERWLRAPRPTYVYMLPE
jgi:hypothetical protein